MMDVMEDDCLIDESATNVLDDDEERELQELERYINGGVHPTGILPGGGREIQMRPQSEIVHRAPSVSHLSTDSTLVMGTRSMVRPASTVATTTVLHLHHPRERRGNVILYDKTPSSSYSFVKVAYVVEGLWTNLCVNFFCESLHI